MNTPKKAKAKSRSEHQETRRHVLMLQEVLGADRRSGQTGTQVSKQLDSNLQAETAQEAANPLNTGVFAVFLATRGGYFAATVYASAVITTGKPTFEPT